MDQQTRHEVERANWDAHAHHTDVTRELGPEDVLPPDETFERYAADHISMSGMAQFLGDLTDRRFDGVILRHVREAWRPCRYGVVFLRKSDSLSEPASQRS